MGTNYVSATQINVANYCDFRYFLRYVKGVQPLRLSAYVRGSLLHQLVENFWKRLGTEEQVEIDKKRRVKAAEKKKYYDAESFADFATRKWMSITIADKTAKEKIAWSYESEPYIIKNTMKKLCIPLFTHLHVEGPPLFSELGFQFYVGNTKFKGFIDEIRIVDGKIVVRDYKSGRPWLGEMKLKHDPQLTLYATAVCALIKEDRDFARALGLEEKFEEFMQGQTFISPLIEEQFFMMDALAVDSEKVKSMPEVINRTSRRDEHFFELYNMILGVKKTMETGNVFPERGRKCDSCDLMKACDSEHSNAGNGLYLGENRQLSLGFAIPLYARPQDLPTISLEQKKFRFRKRKEG